MPRFAVLHAENERKAFSSTPDMGGVTAAPDQPEAARSAIVQRDCEEAKSLLSSAEEGIRADPR